MIKATLACRWHSDQQEPEIVCQTRSRARWRMVTWIITATGERVEAEMITRQRCRLPEILPVALDQVTELVRGELVQQAGFEVYALPRKRARV